MVEFGLRHFLNQLILGILRRGVAPFSSLPLPKNSSESVSSGVSMASTSRSLGSTRKSSDSTEASLRSGDTFILGATSAHRLLCADKSPTFRVLGGTLESH
ncbi:hypothetical protein CRUP_026994 [Coryphaenoides rupestris]|nr:hypothetical protein CRUP_026994 [Coryphaenoides rupestris]